MSVHLTHLPIGIGLLALAFVVYARAGARPLARMRAPALALLGGVLAIASFNFARSNRATLAAGSDAFLLAHLVESGIASQELSAHCAERDYMLCPYRARLPMSTDRFLWVDALDIYPWERRELISREAHRLLRDSLIDHPGLHVQIAASYTLRELARFGTGEGLDSDSSARVEPQFAAFVPRELPAFRASKQHTDEFPWPHCNAYTRPSAGSCSRSAVRFWARLWRRGSRSCASSRACASLRSRSRLTCSTRCSARTCRACTIGTSRG